MTLYDISWKVSEEEYRADKALSYSTIAKYAREGFKGLPTLFDQIETSSLTFGSMVDTLLTEPEKFDDLFIISNCSPISESLTDIAKYLSTNYSSSSFDGLSDTILDNTAIAFNYYANDKYRKYRIKTIRENCKELYEFILKSEGKKVVTQEDYNDAIQCAEELKTNSYTSKFFIPNNPFDNKVETFYQLKFKGNYEGIELRGMLDGIIVDKVNKRIIPFDIKTSFKPEYEFYDSFAKWKYNIQADLYTYLLRQNLDKYEEYKDYTITSYLFVVISRNTKTPMVWRYPVDLDKPFLNEGGKVELDDWRGLVEELNYYLTEPTLPKYPMWVLEYNNITEFL